ncbi:hypothetical protein QTN25_009778 [Entamoeba marina]
MKVVLDNPTFYIISSHLDIISKIVSNAANEFDASSLLPLPEPLSDSPKDINKAYGEYFNTISTYISTKRSVITEGQTVISKLSDLNNTMKKLELMETQEMNSAIGIANETIEKILQTEMDIYNKEISKVSSTEEQTKILEHHQEQQHYWEHKKMNLTNLQTKTPRTYHSRNRHSDDTTGLVPIKQLLNISSTSKKHFKHKRSKTFSSNENDTSLDSSYQKHKRKSSVVLESIDDTKVIKKSPTPIDESPVNVEQNAFRRPRRSSRTSRGVLTEKPKELIVDTPPLCTEQPKEIGVQTTNQRIETPIKPIMDVTMERIEKQSPILKKWSCCSKHKILYDSFNQTNIEDISKIVMNLSYLYFITSTEDHIFGCFVRKPIEVMDRIISDPTHFIFTLPSLNSTAEPKKYHPKDDNWKHSFILGGGEDLLYKINVGGCIEIAKVGFVGSRCVNLSTTYAGLDDSAIVGSNKKKFKIDRLVILQMS